MADVPGTGAPGLFSLGRREEPKEVSAEEGIASGIAELDRRGSALLLEMLGRLQNVEGILRTERVARLTAEATTRTIVLDNEQAEERIIELEQELGVINSRLTDSLVRAAQFREDLNVAAVNISRGLNLDPLANLRESDAALFLERERDRLAAVLGIIIR